VRQRFGPALAGECNAAAAWLCLVAIVELDRAGRADRHLQMQQLTEQARPHHLQRRRQIAAEAYVLDYDVGILVLSCVFNTSQ
jgi:hypothetical protein